MPYRLFLLLTVLLMPAITFAQLNVVVSITPLRLIAESIVGNHGNVRVLVPVSGSPHHYTMTPSDRLALDSADLILYVGEPLETELHGVMSKLAGERRVLEFINLPGLNRRRLDDSGNIDPHIWLDSGNGLLMAAALRDAVTELDADRASLWQENYAALEQRLLDEELQWRRRLQAAPQASYAVYHDAIGYVEDRFGRSPRIVLLDNPEIQPGIRRIMKLRQAIADEQPVCLFTDVTSRQSTVDTLFAGTPVHQVQLDLLGERLGTGEGYPELLHRLVDDFIRCLSRDQN